MTFKAKAGIAIAVILIVVFIFLFLNTDNKQETNRVTVQVQMFEGPESDAMIPTAEYWNNHYARKTGIFIETRALERVGYFDKLELQLISRPVTPDIIHPYSLHLGKIRKFLHPMNNYLADSDIMTAPDGKKLSLEAILPVAMETVKSEGGAIYMIPKDMSEVLLYYRQDLIPTPPSTWDEYIAVAKQFTRSINPDSPTKFGTVMQGKYEMWTFCAALENLWPYGVDVFNPKGEADRRAIEQGLGIFEQLAGRNVFPPEVVNAEHPEVAAIIKNGEVAMAMQWSAFYQELRNSKLSPKVFDKFDVALPPGVRKPDGNIKHTLYVQTINLALNKHSKHKREAMKFLVWATLGKGAEIYARAGGSSPIKAVWENSKISDLYPKIRPWVENYGKAVPVHPRITEMMMIGSGWIQRIMARDVNAKEATAGYLEDIKPFQSSGKEI